MANLESQNSPTIALEAITPSNTADLPGGSCRAIHCAGGDGYAVVLVDKKTTANTIYIVQGGVFPGYFRRVQATGTTATGLIAVY